MATKTTAQILYEDIYNNAPSKGLYVWVNPDETSLLELQRLLADCPFKPLNSTEMHCTVMYHTDDLPDPVEVPEDRVTKGTINELALWDDKDGQKIMVAIVESPSLQKLHKELIGQGFHHSFDDYTAHITLCYEIEAGPKVQSWYEDMNDHLAQNPINVSFDEKIKGASVD